MAESDVNAGATVNAQFSDYNGNLQKLVDSVKKRASELEDYSDSWSSSVSKIERMAVESKKLFEWSDGPLVNAMRVGDAFLLDEISLADDSVLERLNSVLESERLLVLAERGSVDSENQDSTSITQTHVEELRAHANFSFFATMNPGGDYGKKELSPALRNRFTEIWVPPIGDKNDLSMIIKQRLDRMAFRFPQVTKIPSLMLDFLEWFAGRLGMIRTSIVSLRDIMAWVSFISTLLDADASDSAPVTLLAEAVFHGGCMVLLDGIGVNPLFGSMLGSSSAASFRKDCSQRLAEQIFSTLVSPSSISVGDFVKEILFVEKFDIVRTGEFFGIAPFTVKCGPSPTTDLRFTLQAPTTSINALRVLRAMRLSKPVLLEGSPGVGKSSLVSSLAAACGYSLCRINLSEQTDLMDLFGSDLPVEGGSGGEFAWRDGPFLCAMKLGHWVLLDELNLATQQVLEGLNACLDHRATVYIPELNRSFDCHQNFRVFAAQNPQNQGGGRKGLPKSFVNRFTQVYVEALSSDDMAFIVANLHPEVDEDIVKKMIEFNQAMHVETMVKHSFGLRGSPWEFNLRDILRWIELVKSRPSVAQSPRVYLKMMYCQKMRTETDERAVESLFDSFFLPEESTNCSLSISETTVSVGSSSLSRAGRRLPLSRGYVSGDKLELLVQQLPILESLIKCVEMSWMAILCGPSCSGKTSIVRLLAKLAGQQLDEFSMNSGVDAVELLGGFEQVDIIRRGQDVIRSAEHSLEVVLRFMGSANIILGDSKNIHAVYQLQTQLFELKRAGGLLDLDSLRTLLERLDRIVLWFGDSLKTCLYEAGAKLPADIASLCNDVKTLRDSGVHGQFEWIDGTLIKALEEGRWILIDNANLCPASVLDRLNHLLEPNGVLIVNERGLVNGEVKVIHPHKSFRIFMTMDPQLGEISRAMRNRGVEIFVKPLGELSRDASPSPDVVNLLNSHGLPGTSIPRKVEGLHRLVRHILHQSHIAVREGATAAIKLSNLVVERLERGVSWPEAIQQTFAEVYFDVSKTRILSEDATAQVTLALQTLCELGDRPVTFGANSWPMRIDGRYFVEESAVATASKFSSVAAYFALCDTVELEGLKALPSEMHDILLPIPASSVLSRSALFQFVTSHFLPISARRTLLRHIYGKFVSSSKIQQLDVGLDLLSFSETGSDIHEVLNAIEQLLDSLDETSLNVMRVVFSFQCVLRAMKANALLVSELSKPSLRSTELLIEAVEGCYGSLKIREFECSSALWNSSRVATLRTEKLIELERAFTSISDRMSAKRKNLIDILVHPLFGIDKKIRLSVLEGIATLYFLDHSSSTDDGIPEMLVMISALPQQVEEFLNNSSDKSKIELSSDGQWNPSDKPLTVLEEIGTRGNSFGVKPIAEIRSLRIQNLLLGRLASISFSNDSIDKKKQRGRDIISQLQQVIDYEISESSSSPQNLHPFQRILWMLDSRWVESIDDHEFIPQIKSILFEAAYFWHKSIWENSGMILASTDTYDRDMFLCHGNVHEIPKGVQANAGKIGGPQLLNSSSGSKMGLALLGTLEHVPIYAFEGKIKQIHELSSVFSEPVLENFVEEALEAHLDIIMLTLQQIIDGYRGCFAEGVHERIVSRLLAIRVDIFKDSEYVNRMLDETRLLIHSIPENPRGHLKMVLNILSNVATKGLSFESVGQAYIFVSMGFLRSYLPESAIDPALSSQYELEMMSKVAQKIKSDIVVDLEYQYMCLTDSVAHDDQFKKLKEITAASKAIQRKMVYRPKKSEIEQIVNDLTHLGSNVLRDQSIYSCVSDGDSHNRQFLQTSLQAYVEKTEMKYPLYRDILQPVFLSLYQLRLGLSYLEADKNSGLPVEVNDLMKSLLEFTGLMTSSDLDNDKFSVALQKVPIMSSKLAEIDTLLSVIRRFCWGVRYQNALHESDLSALNNWLNKLSNSWLEAEALAAEKEKADAELYKYKEKSHEILTEEEYDEKDLLSVFPDFALDFEFLENNLGEDQDVSQKIDNGVHAGTIDADESVAFKIREMHYSLFSGAANFEDQKESYKRAYLSSFEACSKVLGTAIFPIDYFFETISRAGKLVVSKIRDESLTSVIEDFAKLPKDFDFYKDNNTGEARKLLSILRSLDSVTSSLLEEWPENQILGQLRVITNRIASFSCTSPTMKLLTGLELLFQKCHEWQKYASSAVSVKGILEEMTQLIVRWRKLELQSWKNLLNNEDRAADMKSSKLWFHFFKSLIVPALVHGHDGVAEPFVESDLIATMDQLLLGSTLGGFHGRLSMLWAFHNHLIAICKESPSETADKMIKVLWNVYKYYAQFQDHVRTHIDIQRKPIVKELDGYVRIATWKDVNVFSLKESSKKSHHHLHKFVKKYRAILNLPVKDVIAAYLQNLAVEGTLVVPKLKSQDFSIDSPNVASHLEISGTCLGQRDSEKLFKRMQVLTATATTDNRLKVVDGIEELMDVIFDRVEQFQRPLESKSVKGLRSIRKKALVDLLKYLEFLGLSPNASVRYSKYQSSSFLFTLPKLEFDLSTFKQTGMLEEKLSDRTHGLLQKSDEYYFKLLAKMPVIRESSLTSNKDLSDREISKSSSFLENLLQIIVDERQDLSLCADFLQNVTIKNMER
ncbi:AAA ATPase midasin, partial [Entophlyctis luteolus]